MVHVLKQDVVAFVANLSLEGKSFTLANACEER